MILLVSSSVSSNGAPNAGANTSLLENVAPVLHLQEAQSAGTSLLPRRAHARSMSSKPSMTCTLQYKVPRMAACYTVGRRRHSYVTTASQNLCYVSFAIRDVRFWRWSDTWILERETCLFGALGNAQQGDMILQRNRITALPRSVSKSNNSRS